MNPRTLLELASFAYLDLPERYQRRLAAGEAVPLSEVARELRRVNDLGALNCGAYLERVGPLLDALGQSRIGIVGYIDNNRMTGFVAYAFLAPGREAIVAVRGSEMRNRCVPSNIDWRDNICGPLAGSVQYADAIAFADRFPEGSLILTGHSKGGNVALHAQGGAENPLARAAVFNAQGFARDGISREQRARMRAGAVNYVVAGDLIGALLYHPEERFFVRQVPGTNAHSPEALAFDEAGWPIPAGRTLASVGVEILSRALLALQRLGFAPGVWKLINCPEPNTM